MKALSACAGLEPERKFYPGIVPGIRGAHTEPATLDYTRLTSPYDAISNRRVQSENVPFAEMGP